MSSRAGSFWWFQFAFWSIAGTALFISGLTQTDPFPAFIRNVFLTIAGYLTSFFLTALIDRLRHMDELRLRLVTFPVAYLVALACVVVVNAISFTLAGYDYGQITGGMWFSGVMNFALVYWFWTELFIQQVYLKSGSGHKPGEVYAAGHDHLVVDDRGTLQRLKLDSISAITAAGDYVEIVTRDRTYLDRRTIQSLDERLAPAGFLRIHRSAIVNPAHASAIKPLPRGRYEIELRDGQRLSSSGSYETVVKERIVDQHFTD